VILVYKETWTCHYRDQPKRKSQNLLLKSQKFKSFSNLLLSYMNATDAMAKEAEK